MAAPQVTRAQTEEAFLDAAERLLVELGYAGVTTRRVAAEAGLNHGLVHYYFGSVENLLVRVLERFTERLIARQRAMYADPSVPSPRSGGRRCATSRPTASTRRSGSSCRRSPGTGRSCATRVAHVHDEWRAVLTEAFAEPRERYGIPIPLDALVTLVLTFNEGIILERLSGVEAGHARAPGLDRRLARRRRRRDRPSPARRAEQTRARYPDEEGYVERDGVRVFYEVYGDGEPTVLLLPTWSIIHSRHWKMQIPYLARHCRVLTFDGRGNGKVRPSRRARGLRRARVRGRRDRRHERDRHGAGGDRRLLDGRAARSPPGGRAPRASRRSRFIGPSFPRRGEPLRERWESDFDEEYDTDEGWAKYNQPLLAARLPGVR